jgi:hypothetical protein
MQCGGGGDGQGRGGVEGHLYNSRQKKLIDHDGRWHRTAAMGPHSRQKSIQQSTNILFERVTLLKLEKNIVITIFMTIFGTTHQRIFVPDVRRFRWPYRRCRASAATATAHIRIFLDVRYRKGKTCHWSDGHTLVLCSLHIMVLSSGFGYTFCTSLHACSCDVVVYIWANGLRFLLGRETILMQKNQRSDSQTRSLWLA